MKWYDRAKKRMKHLGIKQDDLRKPLQVKTRGAIGHYLSYASGDQYQAEFQKVIELLDKNSKNYPINSRVHSFLTAFSEALVKENS